MYPTFTPLGDSALTVTFGDSIDEQVNDKVISLFTLVKQKSFPGFKDLIPAYATLTIIYDAFLISQLHDGSPYSNVCEQILQLLEEPEIKLLPGKEIIDIPVCYHPGFGTDILTLAKDKSISPDEIIDLHSTVIYKVYMIGFLPGFAYMGSVNKKIATPRKAIPTLNIPAGSVGIAGEQTGIYPLHSPGGWNIIGRTPLTLFDANAGHPCLLNPGDLVKFTPITLEEFEMLTAKQ